MTDRCLGCDATETYCVEVGGCCDGCDHRPGSRACRALITIDFGAILHEIEYAAGGRTS